MNNTFKIIGGLLVLLSLWLIVNHFTTKRDTATTSTVLAPDEQAKIIINPREHKISVVTPGHVEEHYMSGSRPESITEKNGHLLVNSPSFGAEKSPFFSLLYSEAPRVAIGVNLLYYRRLDLGLGLSSSLTTPLSLRPYACIGYNVYSNTSVVVGVDFQLRPIIGTSLRF
jgi:hypothetical protein